MSAKGRIEIDGELCKGCELCINVCPKKLIIVSESFNSSGYQAALFKESDDCTGCAICALVCPDVAIEVYRG